MNKEVIKFEALGLHKNILKALSILGYSLPTPVQEACVPLILQHKDVIASAQTGTGKTAAFALPILHLLLENQNAEKRSKKIKTLVISPTRELTLQIADSFKEYAKYTNLRIGVVYGGISMAPQIDILKKGVDILVATPGRLLDLRKRNLLKLGDVEILVVDEADLMLDMGFIDDVRKIARLCPSQKQSLLFSATMPNKIVDLAQELLINPERISISKNAAATKKVVQKLYYVPKPKKMELCLHILRNNTKGQIIIFRRTKFGVDKLEKSLLKNGHKVASLHGDKSQAARQQALDVFKKKEVNILVATDVASRGIDINGLDAVFNFDMPNVPEIYVHRIGRSGRAGLEGKSFSFCSADEKSYIEKIERLMKKSIDVVTDHPYPLDPKAKAEVHVKRDVKVKTRRKGRKSAASKKNKKRWY